MARAPGKDPADRDTSDLARQVIEKIDDDDPGKVFLAAVINGCRRQPKQFADLLITKANPVHGNYFTAMVRLLEDKWGTRVAMGILEQFARRGIDVQVATLAPSLEPIAVVAKFKALLVTYNEMRKLGRISQDDQLRVVAAAAKVAGIVGPIEKKRKVGPRIKVAAGAGVAAGVLWEIAADIAAANVTGIGVALDVAIPFVIVGAAALSTIALIAGTAPPEILDYEPAQAAAKAVVQLIQQVIERPVPIGPRMPPRRPPIDPDKNPETPQKDLDKNPETPQEEPPIEPPIKVGPEAAPQPFEPPPKREKKKCRHLCPGTDLPIRWPAELPPPSRGKPGKPLERVSSADNDWYAEPRGGPQRTLQDEIKAARGKEEVPRPCFEDENHPNLRYHAHHIHPLFLHGNDESDNLCALEEDRHKRGHPKLFNQSAIAAVDPDWENCWMCSTDLRKHLVGQGYEPEKFPF